MHKYEFPSLVISALALVVSVTTPILTYYWFDTNSKEFEHRGRFVVVDVYWSAEATTTQKNRPPKNVVEVYKIKNVGMRPAANAQLVVVRSNQSQKWPGIKFSPELVSVSRRDGHAE